MREWINDFIGCRPSIFSIKAPRLWIAAGPGRVYLSGLTAIVATSNRERILQPTLILLTPCRRNGRCLQQSTKTCDTTLAVVLRPPFRRPSHRHHHRRRRPPSQQLFPRKTGRRPRHQSPYTSAMKPVRRLHHERWKAAELARMSRLQLLPQCPNH